MNQEIKEKYSAIVERKLMEQKIKVGHVNTFQELSHDQFFEAIFEAMDEVSTRPAPDMTEAIVETVIELNLKCFWSGNRTWIDDYKKGLHAAITDLQEKPYYCHCDQPDFHHNDTTSCKRCGRPFDLRVD